MLDLPSSPINQQVVQKSVEGRRGIAGVRDPTPDSADQYADTRLTSSYCGSTWVRKNGRKLFGAYTSHLCVPMARTPGMVGYICQDAARHIVEKAVPVNREADRMRCADQLKFREQWRVVLPHLVEHAPSTRSILDEFGGASRRSRKPRLLGIYLPPLRQMAQSLKLGAFGRFMGMKSIGKPSVSRFFDRLGASVYVNRLDRKRTR